MSFDSFGLDPRLLQGMADLGFNEPTLVQSEAIPLALQERKDIVARARTGSGKTAAYVIPIIQSLLTESSQDDSTNGTKALILVPSKELSAQVTKLIKSMIKYCGKNIKAPVNVAQTGLSDKALASLLVENPSIVIGTPSRIVKSIKQKEIAEPQHIKFLVLDESDLLVSYGYQDDLAELAELIPVGKTIQTFVMSATLSDEVDEIKKKFCRHVAVLKLEGDDDEDVETQGRLIQYYVNTNELDKFLLAYVIFKLGLIKGKTIVFVNDIDRGYRLKLFLEQFGIRSCILNAELPVASRLHVVEEFNKSVYNLLIATDERDERLEEEHEDAEEINNDSNKDKQSVKDKDLGKGSSKRKTSHKKDKEYGMSRGIDFQNVACVLNFDLPTSSRAYTHRIGRTARSNKSGMSLSFVVLKQYFGKHKASSLPSAVRDEKVLERIIKAQAKHGHTLQPYQFDNERVEGFRYRMEDAFRAVTKVAVREARIKEIRNQLLASDKLKRHFDENPQDLSALRFDNEMHPARIQSHLKRVPDYLLPKNNRQTKEIGPVGFKRTTENRIRKARNVKRGRKKDPLKAFRA